LHSFVGLVLALLSCRRPARVGGHPLARLFLPALTILASAAVTDLSRARGAPPGAPEAGALYRQHCQRCHGADGKGDGELAGLPSRPDFTRRAWQEQRKDAQLLASILDGRDKAMPAFRDRLSEAQGRSLITHIRAFAPGTSPTGESKQTAPTTSADDFDRELRRLQKEYDQLKRQVKEVDSAPRRPAKPPPGVAERLADAKAGEGAVPAAGALYRQHCQRCHGADGKGGGEVAGLPTRPDFTHGAWQEARTDAQLLASILDGKGSKMPPWREKISEEQARGLVAYLRAFAPISKGSAQEEQKEPTWGSLEERRRRLQGELDELERQFRELSKSSPPAASAPSVPAGTPIPATRELFQKRCTKCHGADGTGKPARDRLPEIPDFTDISWQARQGDAQLLASILDGKEPEMPHFRDKISEEEARGLAAYVRGFAPTGKRPGQEEQEGPTPAEPAEAKPPGGFFEKMTRWLGRSHPAAVHFPIALLTAAAVAELLRMLTRKPAFDAVSRFCVWFGTLTAVVAGILGWLLGGFHLADASRVMMTHRWLGSSTIACAGLVLLISEVSRRPDRGRTRLWFRVSLLVLAVLALATGFFGGAVVHGLDHYAWPS
jgi:mono/diheme cytochrome c family protein/uncharacterized membrane protein